MRKDKIPSYDKCLDFQQFKNVYDQALKEELLLVVSELNELFIKYELSQEEACCVALYSINKMVDITKPIYATIKLNSLNS